MTQRVARLSTCNLCQWAMDFHGNLLRIKESISQAKKEGARYRVCRMYVTGSGGMARLNMW